VTASLVADLAPEHRFQQPIVSFAFIPSGCATLSSNVFTSTRPLAHEICNSLLGLNALIDFCDAAFLIDNSALERSVPFRSILSPKAAHQAMNVTAAAAISSTTCAQRFPLLGAECLQSWRKFIHTSVLYPRAHFYSLSHAPFSSVGGSDGPTHRTAANLVQEVLTESACLAGLPDDPIEDSRVAISFFNFACVRGRQILWNDMARALEAIKEQRTLMHVRRGAWEYDDDQQSDGEGLPVDASLESGKKDFIPCDKWLPDAHLRYAYCPVPFPLPQARPGPSTTLVSSNTRTYSSYLMRLLLRFEMTKQHCEELYSKDPLLLWEARSNLEDLILEFSRS
jgi:hypothetical protein